MIYLRWRWFRMDVAYCALKLCPSRFRTRLFDFLEAVRFLDIDHLEDVANVFPEFYEGGY